MIDRQTEDGRTRGAFSPELRRIIIVLCAPRRRVFSRMVEVNACRIVSCGSGKSAPTSILGEVQFVVFIGNKCAN